MIGVLAFIIGAVLGFVTGVYFSKPTRNVAKEVREYAVEDYEKAEAGVKKGVELVDGKL